MGIELILKIDRMLCCFGFFVEKKIFFNSYIGFRINYYKVV